VYSGHRGIAEEQRLVGNNYIANIMTGMTNSNVVTTKSLVLTIETISKVLQVRNNYMA